MWGMEVNSWATPSIWIEVTAAPQRDDSSTRRSVLPSVIPKPGSSGSISNLPNVSVPPSSALTEGATETGVSIANLKKTSLGR